MRPMVLQTEGQCSMIYIIFFFFLYFFFFFRSKGCTSLYCRTGTLPRQQQISFGVSHPIFSALNAGGGFLTCHPPSSFEHKKDFTLFFLSLSLASISGSVHHFALMFYNLLDTGVMGRHNKGLPCGKGDLLTYLPLVLFENNHRTHPRCLSSRLFAHRAAIANMQPGGGGSDAVTMALHQTSSTWTIEAGWLR